MRAFRARRGGKLLDNRCRGDYRLGGYPVGSAGGVSTMLNSWSNCPSDAARGGADSLRAHRLESVSMPRQ